MPAKTKRSGRPPSEPRELFIFEIKDCQPFYNLSINYDPLRKGAFHEIINMELETACTYPEKFIGRPTFFHIYGERNYMEPAEYQKDSKWKPRCVAFLELPPSGGSCSVHIPHESMTFLMSAITQKRIRFVFLHGPQLKRGASFCNIIEFMQSADG